MPHLHLGCGTRRLLGYIHVDSRSEVKPDVVADVTDLHHFSDDYADLIYACHVLEHVSKPDVGRTLTEWHRVLKPGGVLRLSVPDFDVMARLYLEEGVHLIRLLGLLYGGQDYQGNAHHSTYNYETLAHRLAIVGFHSVRRWRPKKVLPKGYDDYSLAKINGKSVSLNIEATAR